MVDERVAEKERGGDASAQFELPEPRMAADHWIWDQMHHPLPVRPYTSSVDGPAMTLGTTAAFRALGAPLQIEAAQVNGYWYVAFRPDADLVPDSWMPEAQQRVIGHLIGLLDRWRDVLLPEVMRLNERLRDFDYAAATDDELIALIDESAEQRARQWEIHFSVVAPMGFVAGRLSEMWAEAFGAERAHEALTLIGGFPNKTVEAGAELWKLSRDAQASPEVAALIARTPVQRIVPLLGTTEAGRAFLARLREYLGAYGYRSGAFEFADASWIEDPSVPLATLRDFMKQPEEMDPARHAAKATAARQALQESLAAEIDARPEAAMLRMVLTLAQQYLPIQEDHNFYIDQMHTVLMRKPPLEAGRRLATADALALAEDVFWLTIEELKAALRAPASREWAELVLERRALAARQAELTPPPTLGSPPPEAMAGTGVAAFFGEPIEQDLASNVLRGTAASRGSASGTARVILSLEDAHRLAPGEILICPMTMPAWTPLFAIAAAVVTDTGGTLSHSAIVAREYGIPCVVGTTGGTRRIADGQHVTVDGTAGTVTID